MVVWLVSYPWSYLWRFSEGEYYLYKVKFPFMPLVIKNGFIYKVEYSSLDDLMDMLVLKGSNVLDLIY